MPKTFANEIRERLPRIMTDLATMLALIFVLYLIMPVTYVTSHVLPGVGVAGGVMVGAAAPPAGSAPGRASASPGCGIPTSSAAFIQARFCEASLSSVMPSTLLRSRGGRPALCRARARVPRGAGACKTIGRSSRQPTTPASFPDRRRRDGWLIVVGTSASVRPSAL